MSMPTTTRDERAAAVVGAQDFKDVLTRWASGVTIVTARAEGDAHGATVSSFSSVSVEPPLVLVCLFRGSRTREVVAGSGRFTINVLAEGQSRLAERFAGRRAPEEPLFDGVEWSLSPGGVPRLGGTAASLECSVVSAYEEGTHTIFVGRVESAAVDAARRPLLYWERAFRRLDVPAGGDGRD
jgi:flavin reductase (DIM6/NTAB) family NADH-FMN oxidoreductase RutF